MASEVYFSPFIPTFNGNGLPVPGARLYFFYTGTTTPAPIYSDSGMTTPLANPVISNAAAQYPNIYLDAAITYRVRVTDRNGTQLGNDIDPYVPGTALEGPPGPPGGNISSLGLAAAATTFDDIPDGTATVTTAGFLSDGVGAARYARWSPPMAPLDPSTQEYAWFEASDGSRWVIAEDNPTIEMFGASVDAADNGPNILAALKTSKNVIIPATVGFGFGCNAGAVKCQMDDQSISGIGTLTLNGGQLGTLVSSNGYRVHLSGFGLEGLATGDVRDLDFPASNRSGLAIDMDKKSTINGVRINAFANYGLYPANTGEARQRTLSASDVKISNCFYGFYLGVQVAEYTTWSNCHARECKFGVVIASGNISWMGGALNDNYRAVHVTDAPNNAHGSMVGTLLNHAQEAMIFCEGVTHGFSFIGCQMFDGTVVLDDCYGVQIMGCTTDVTTWNFGGGGYNRVAYNTIEGFYANTIVNNYGGVLSQTEFTNNRKYDGSYWGEMSAPQYGQAAYTPGDQPVNTWWENGSFGTDGWRWTTNGDGTMKLFKVTAGVQATDPTFVMNRLTGKITKMLGGFTDYADDAAAASGGVPVGGIYHTAGVLHQRVA